MFGFGTTKCAQCGMKLESGMQVHEWQDKKFCSQECKQNFRHEKNSGKMKCC